MKHGLFFKNSTPNGYIYIYMQDKTQLIPDKPSNTYPTLVTTLKLGMSPKEHNFAYT